MSIPLPPPPWCLHPSSVCIHPFAISGKNLCERSGQGAHTG